MKNYIGLMVLLAFIVISCSTVTFQPFTEINYAPTDKVDLYTDKKPEREYFEIGRIISGEDAFSGEENIVKWAIEEAKKVGADGLIWMKEDKQFYAIPVAGSVVAGEEKQVIFIAIKYKE